jgi:DNA-binding GntR family transcriptional regulator
MNYGMRKEKINTKRDLVMNKNIRISTTALYQEVATRLRSRIYSQDLLPGVAIDEKALAEEYGISRTPMREALKVLHSEGLVVLEPRRGCFVTELKQQDIDELFPLMALLEGRCAYEAVKKAKPADIKRIEDLHNKLEKLAAAGDVDKYFEQNCMFHELVQKLSGNNWLERTTNDLRKFLKLLRGRQLHLPGRLQESLSEHRMLLAAFQNHNSAAAEKIMHDHLMSQYAALNDYDKQNILKNT